MIIITADNWLQNCRRKLKLQQIATEYSTTRKQNSCKFRISSFFLLQISKYFTRSYISFIEHAPVYFYSGNTL